MNITKAEAAALGRRADQPVKAPGDLLAVFVAGKLVNTKNARLHYMAEHRYKAGWRERVAMALLESEGRGLGLPLHVRAATPKAVTITCNVGALMDSVDGLRVACAPITDALKQCAVIDDDRDSSGHEFTFTQTINRAQRGVEIRVRLREGRPDE